jgi:hypothetical protein
MSVARASRELDMPKMALWKVLRKRRCLNLYKMRLVQALTPADEVKRREFCKGMQLKMEEDGLRRKTYFLR